MQIFEKSKLSVNNKQLIFKVLSSGHKSLIEHYVFNLAFSGVSVLAEQFIIEFRLASYTVQSRRYVDYRDAGFYTPDGLTAERAAAYADNMNFLFGSYEKLLEAGIPKEDARFVLPYCFKSNFFCTCNARELVRMISSMLYGRGKYDPEILAIGQSLKEQFDAYMPGVVEKESGKYPDDVRYAENNNAEIAERTPRGYSVGLLSATPRPAELLNLAARYNYSKNGKAVAARGLALTERARELEFLSYSFLIKNISLAAITHIARHRIQTLLIPHVQNAVIGGGYILPESIKNDARANGIYEEAFARNSESLKRLLSGGMKRENAVYFALSGNTLDIMVGMNARELSHFFNLRTCRRAQWEIRGIA
jgi:thymidylate synthase (FAD)